ncbi:tetratricopeptide repeat protein 21B-like isoform X2 [Cylas formicarius]|uniref:tetratricopeptide repeat protein 21B-like isoform X2 n=1 Tax=Cylas formicarius TaxID=197179 RepID=UPI00295859C0|nr:tetratricopeptide repeat protein 21B-like isoform X2 [Cylas formicarius]
MSDEKSIILYHFRHKFYNLMLNVCKEAMARHSTDVSFRLYHALGLFLTNRLEEGVHDLEAVREENGVKLASTIALVYGHQTLGVPNQELYSKLDTQMKELRKTADADDYFHSAFVLLVLGKPDKALDYVERALASKGGAEYLALKGWLLLTLKTAGDNAKTVFHNALQLDGNHVTSVVGYSECLLRAGDTQGALDVVNRALVRRDTHLLLLQKIKIHFARRDWDQCLHICAKVNVADGDVVYASLHEALIALCGASPLRKDLVRKHFELLERWEPSNHRLVLETAAVVAKLCCGDEAVLHETTKALEDVVRRHSDDADVVVELGRQKMALDRPKEASRLFKSATRIDESCFEALLGLAFCEWRENGLSEQLRQQVHYLQGFKEAEESPRLLLLRARTNPENAVVHLERASALKVQTLEAFYYSDTYLLNLDPDLVLDVAKEYLKLVPGEKQDKACAVLEALDVVVKACPGLVEARSTLARVHHFRGDDGAALSVLEGKFDVLPGDGILLMAQIQAKRGEFDRASQTLEACVSRDFGVRESPVYHYVTALIDKYAGNYADCIKALTTALNLVEGDVALVEKASIYVELIDTLNVIGQQEQANQVLEKATEDLKGTAEEASILLLSADNLVARKDIQGALDLLNDMGRREAKIKMADILLKYRRDKYAFVQVYRDLVDEDPSAESYLMLGDAYMTILEPDDALLNYEMALKENPNDATLAGKMGGALVDAHYFARAVEYYKKAIKGTGDRELKLQLAELYYNLKEYEKGELLLLDELEAEKMDADLEELGYLRYKSKVLYALARMQEKSGNLFYAEKTLKEAMENQTRVKKRLAIERNAVPDAEIALLVDIALKLADTAISLKNHEQAVNYYKESLTVSPNNISILVALARQYMQMNYLELCQQTCASVLRIDADNEAASVMMADIAFRKVDFDMALFHFTQLIGKQPTNWEALVRLLEISRRLGTIADGEEHLDAAEKRCAVPSKEPGLIYCRAYFEWHSGNLNAALKDFNQVRQDGDFGRRALVNMIEICLNPDDETLAEQFMDSDDIEYRDSRTLALKTADRLIKELKQRSESNAEHLLQCRVLANFRLLATKEKFNIERALEDFVAIASHAKENVGAILGMSTAYTLLKQGQRARNQLKRVVKTTWTFEDAEYLERCWLLLADHYIQSGKLEAAHDLVTKVVDHNKACTKAYEYLGFIAEKEHGFKEAATNYQRAWKTGGGSNPGVGYKLAYCLMKGKRYPDAIDAVYEVLKVSPDYPNIKKDILDKCMNNLRV